LHRIAYLVRVRRENPRGILALAYNRHAAVEIRRRLVSLIGDDAKGVTVLTCHALAMRMVGASLVGRATDTDTFDDILRQAIALLKGEGLAPDEADAQREQLLAGFRWILVDEYQDVGLEQYELITALAGMTLNDPDGRLSLYAVGDDDQNIYSFNGASVEFIRRFEEDYAAKPSYLTENYRSSLNIIDASNRVIEVAGNRMKAEHPIKVDRARKKTPAGGQWESLDPVSRGCVQILRSKNSRIDQAVVTMKELERLAALDADWDWTKVAVLSREWIYLEPVRSYCELNGIPVQMADEQPPPMWRLRETRQLMDWIEGRESSLIDITSIQAWLSSQGSGPWWEQLMEVVEALGLEVGDAEIPVQHFVEWLVEWGREIRNNKHRHPLIVTIINNHRHPLIKNN
jgi:ATP-dependent DNA helicase RecQ